MNKTIHDSLKTTRRYLLKNSELSENANQIDIKKFKPVYEALSQKNKTYDKRLQNASELIDRIMQEQDINNYERDYLSSIIEKTTNFMNNERKKRKVASIDQKNIYEAINKLYIKSDKELETPFSPKNISHGLIAQSESLSENKVVQFVPRRESAEELKNSSTIEDKVVDHSKLEYSNKSHFIDRMIRAAKRGIAATVTAAYLSLSTVTPTLASESSYLKPPSVQTTQNSSNNIQTRISSIDEVLLSYSKVVDKKILKATMQKTISEAFESIGLEDRTRLSKGDSENLAVSTLEKIHEIVEKNSFVDGRSAERATQYISIAVRLGLPIKAISAGDKIDVVWEENGTEVFWNTTEGRRETIKEYMSRYNISQRELEFKRFLVPLSTQELSGAVHKNIAEIYATKGKPKKALEALNDAIQLHPQNSFAWAYRAYINGVLNKKDLAVIDYKTAISLHPSLESAHLDLGSILLQQKKISEAEEHYRIAHELNPNNPVIKRYADNALELKTRNNILDFFKKTDKNVERVVFYNERTGALIDASLESTKNSVKVDWQKLIELTKNDGSGTKTDSIIIAHNHDVERPASKIKSFEIDEMQQRSRLNRTRKIEGAIPSSANPNSMLGDMGSVLLAEKFTLLKLNKTVNLRHFIVKEGGELLEFGLTSETKKKYQDSIKAEIKAEENHKAERKSNSTIEKRLLSEYDRNAAMRRTSELEETILEKYRNNTGSLIDDLKKGKRKALSNFF